MNVSFSGLHSLRLLLKMKFKRPSRPWIPKRFTDVDSVYVHPRTKTATTKRTTSKFSFQRKFSTEFHEFFSIRKSIPRKRELAIEDVTRHLVFAFSGFLGRQAATEGLDEEKKGKMELVQEILKEIYELPEDDTLKISRDLELIFLQNNRREIPVPKEETKEDEEETEVKEEPTEADDTTEIKEENGAEDETEEVKEEAAEDEIVEEEKDEESALIDELGERVGEMIEDQADQDQEDQVEEEEQEGAEEQAEEVSEVPAVAKSPSRGRGGRGGRGRGGRGRKT